MISKNYCNYSTYLLVYLRRYLVRLKSNSFEKDPTKIGIGNAFFIKYLVA